ncbi:MAG: hypothetical protein WBX38_01275 [Candidatus Sulfotelmatobacter sp.]
MNTKQFLSSARNCGKTFLWAFLAVAPLASVSFGQTIPGTLTDTEKTTTTVNGTCTILTETYTWTFKDPAGVAHGFPSPSILTSYLSANHSCYGNVISPANEWSSDGLYYLQGTVGSATEETVTGVGGFVNPKYKIVGIAYTVPGEQSYVQYTDTTMMGTNTSTSSSFSTAVSSSIEICGGAGIGGNGTSICGTYSNSFTQESDTSSSFAVSQSTSFTNKWSALDGPAIDHGNDVVYLWVNPQVWYAMYPTSSTGPTSLNWNGYTYDETDDSNNMEVIPLRLTWLQNPSTIPAGLQGRLLRAWAPKNTDGTGPGLTTQDYLNIAAADPFSNSKYVVTIGSDGKTTTDDRFTQTTNGELYYEEGFNDVYNWAYTTTDTEGQGGKNTYADSFAIEVKNSVTWIAHMSFDWKESTTFTWVDSWNTLMTQMMSQSNTVSITGPTAPYTGPNEFNVYQDNVYGTFMVYPVPPE